MTVTELDIPTITAIAQLSCPRRTTVTTGDGIDLAVTDYQPTGPATHTVILLHGLCLSQQSWALQIRHLRRRWSPSVRIITYDHRGHGQSACAPTLTYTIGQLGDDLATVIDAMDIAGPLIVGGHSMGGMTALQYLSQAPQDQPAPISALVLAGSAAGHLTRYGLGRLLSTPGLETLVGLVDHCPHVFAEHIVRTLAGPLCALLTRHGYGGSERHALAATAAGAIHSTPWRTAVGFLPTLKTYDQHSILATLATPTVVVSGANDVLTPPCHAEELAAAMPLALHVAVPGCGHMLLHEASHVVSEALDRSLTTLAA
ncbi:alpha/beta hydrolase [Mycobacteroides abscessus subsp. abscessus]|jgi:pimeloyl-ACP methyl ester carboxylesterase|uniref:alpha/beta fold hydrolase n=1 Tax=Mycobacteroides abscessus TaxID=36809 RepID=UPI00266B7114|nr:alpha/beta hydrolase [Mycobacteroides abscessus]MDO3014595.1 alpha/beta hydrolase [Mycobacteroides abscessus subsp. abscessus]